MSGIFITFEGPDGAGKTTQLELLAEFVKQQGLPCLTTREPGGTDISDRVREIILNPAHTEMAPETEIYLYAASRAQHVHEKIKPALDKGTVVLCDRFVEASVAYQGYGLGYGEDLIRQMNELATGGLKPQRTYLIDINPEVGRGRMNGRKQTEFQTDLDRIEQKELHYHQRVREGFKALANSQDHIHPLDGNQSIEDIQFRIRKDFKRLVETKKD
ncbi:dTMP kinase [Caldalkalibacillus salinus]|uniref:dTMP kinase n=1 Tax=Caldalkalibacillus salinus TaxID=2803787 RepID=UPI0019210CDC